MFFHISIHSIKAHEVSDNPFDPFDNAIEVYQTWHLAALEDIAETSSTPGEPTRCAGRRSDAS